MLSLTKDKKIKQYQFTSKRSVLYNIVLYYNVVQYIILQSFTKNYILEQVAEYLKTQVILREIKYKKQIEVDFKQMKTWQKTAFLKTYTFY